MRTARAGPLHPARGGRAVLTAAAGALLLLSGCTTAEPEGATFVLPSTDAVECQEHQTVGPSDAYAGDEDSDTVAMLDLLRYWNQNGDKPYCDGEPPTATDTEWAETVERLQGS
jgi:hypothetical protein